MQSLVDAIKHICQEDYQVDIEPVLSRPQPEHGDYATNIAMQLAGRLAQSPRDIAQTIAERLQDTAADIVSEVAVAGPGFINIRLQDSVVIGAAAASGIIPQANQGKVIVTEYSDMNPFKQAHVGHLYTTIMGDVVSRLYEATGATVHRVNFGGDVGLHVAKTMWGIINILGGEKPEGLGAAGETIRDKISWISSRYVEGNKAYETNETGKQQIIDYNKRVYQIHEKNDHDTPFAQIYWTCRSWSYDYFKEFYDELQVTQFERYYPESETTPRGIATVQEQLARGVYKHSEGAVVFDGEAYGLHTRVFINQNGLPTYEAKDIGLSIEKWQDYHFDTSVIITGNDIVEYMKVVLKSIEQFEPELAKRTLHITHGNVKLAGGVKMSSRLGNGLSPEDVLQAARAAGKQATGKDDENAAIGAVKYAFLRSRIGADIIYDAQESVSIQGNSGPYLQYAHARARSILRKAAEQNASATAPTMVEPAERQFAAMLTQYPEIVTKAANELMPHHICTYLYELAQAFNHFYEHNRVLDSNRQAERLQLVSWYADVLGNGLGLLGIVAPEQM